MIQHIFQLGFKFEIQNRATVIRVTIYGGQRERERERESPDHFFYRVLKNRFGVIDGKSERRFHSFLFRFNKTRGLRRNLCRFPHRFLRRRWKFPNNYHRRSLLGTRAIITGALRSRTLLGLPIFIESPFVFNLYTFDGKPLSSCCPSSKTLIDIWRRCDLCFVNIYRLSYFLFVIVVFADVCSFSC